MRRMYKYGLLDPAQNKLDYVLALTPQDFLERRLQTQVFKLGLAKSIHHARVLIKQRHIRWGGRVCKCRPGSLLSPRLLPALTRSQVTQLWGSLAGVAFTEVTSN